MARRTKLPVRARGRAGETHCGSWLSVEPDERYGYATRIVCIREPDHAGQHEDRNGNSFGIGTGRADG